MTSYPPTPAFGGFPIPAPKGPPGLSQDLRKLSINSVGSTNTTLPSPATQSPNYLPKFSNNSSASRQPLSVAPSVMSATSLNSMDAPSSGLNRHCRRDGGSLEDREEGELSDADDLEESHVNSRPNNRSGSKQRDRGIQSQHGREVASHGLRANGEVPNHSPITRSQTWAYRNEPYRRESVSQTWNQQGLNRKKSFDLSSAGPPIAPRSELEKKFDPPSQPKGMGNEKGNFRDRNSSGSGNVAPPPSGPKNQSPSYHAIIASRGMHISNSPVHVSAPRSLLETPKTAAEFRIEAQRAVLNMLPLKVTFKYMVDEAGIDANVLKKVFTGIGLPLPTETPSPSPSGDIDHPHRVVAKHKSREKSSDKMEIDKEAQSIRKHLKKSARDRERREAEAKAAELVRQREAAKEEEEKKSRLAEVEAKKEVLRRKIDEMKLPGKSASPVTPLTLVSSTPVMEVIARASALPPPKTEVPRIPGLLLGQLDGCYSDTPSPPGTMLEQCDTIMNDSPEPATSHSSGYSTTVSAVASNISTTPTANPSPERLLAQRRKRPVASDMYSEPMPTTKRKFGDQRKVPIELIIDISEEEEEEEEEDPEHTGDDLRTSRSTPSGTDPRKSTANGNNSPPRRTSNTAPTGGFATNGTHSKLDSAKALQDKEAQIRALKEAIQKAQQMKKMRAKTGMSTPTSVGTPDIGTGPSAPPPLTQKQQQQVTDVAVAVSSALDNRKMEDETARQKEKKQEILLAQVAWAKARADAVKLKESRKKEKEEKMKVLLTEIEEMEKSETEKRRKKAEEAEAAEKWRQQAKEDMEKKLKEAEGERQKSRMALMKIQQEYERMKWEASEMEMRKEALKSELAAMEKVVEQTVDIMGQGDETANQTILQKKEEIEQLKKAMEESEVEQTTFDSNTTSFPGLQLAKPDVLEDLELEIDVVMTDNVETKINGLVGTDQQPQAPILERTEITASQVLTDTLEDAMELDQQMDEEGKVNEDDVYTDFDMDTPTDEEGNHKEDIVISIGSRNEMEEIPIEEEKQPESGKARILNARRLRTPIPMTSLEPLQGVVAPKLLERNAVVEGANIPTSVPEQGKHIEKLVDPAKITSTTATTSDDKKQGKTRAPPQPEHVFTPYKSPLTNFKSFRYHPYFLEFCPGGYKSLTFSNRIDPLKPLCRWELSGGICSDTSCIGQHQKQLEVPDDEILVELASVVEGSNEEERNNYNRGLRQAIAAMREQGIKDFQTVVAGIASYRRRFLGDETRVLRLPYPPAPPAPPPQQQQVLSSFSSYT